MTILERVLETIKEAGGPICDECIRKRTGVKHHAQVTQRAHRLRDSGDVVREGGVCTDCEKAVQVNSLPVARAGAPMRPVAARPSQETAPVEAPASALAAQTKHPEWYWEGNVQAALVSWLSAHGYAIRRVAHTASREAGKDVVAETPTGKTIWISVKGFPTPKGSATAQARVWFSGAVLDMALYRHENREVDLALALPDGFPTYRNLAARCTWLREALPCRVFWVSQSGEVTEE